MTHPVRPVASFILRLWREPGDAEGDAGWRGQLCPLGVGSPPVCAFQGLEKLPEIVRPLLPAGDAAAEAAACPAEHDSPRAPCR